MKVTPVIQRHRERGISFDMFLGLMKYYHQSYQDLIRESKFSASEKHHFSNIINRFFDRVEIAFSIAWFSSKEDHAVELQDRNRQMTNEKNKYLTIFESLFEPVFIVAPDGKIESMNLAASKIFDAKSVPGSKYYTDSKEELIFKDIFPWLSTSYDDFVQSKEQSSQIEISLDIKEQYFHVSFSRSLDISGKFSGTIVIIADITKRKKMEGEILKIKKLEATAILAGGIAHDFNNLLGVIIGNIDMAIDDLRGENSTRKLLENAMRASERARVLTKKFIIFSSGGILLKRSFSISELLKTILKDESLADVHFDCSLAHDLLDISVDRDQLNEALPIFSSTLEKLQGLIAQLKLQRRMYQVLMK